MSAKGLHTFPPHFRLSNNNHDSPRAHTPHPHTLSSSLPSSLPLSLTQSQKHTHNGCYHKSPRTHTHSLFPHTHLLTRTNTHTFYYNPNSGKFHNKHINRALRWRGIRTHQPCGPSGTTSRPSCGCRVKYYFVDSNLLPRDLSFHAGNSYCPRCRTTTSPPRCRTTESCRKSGQSGRSCCPARPNAVQSLAGPGPTGRPTIGSSSGYIP